MRDDAKQERELPSVISEGNRSKPSTLRPTTGMFLKLSPGLRLHVDNMHPDASFEPCSDTNKCVIRSNKRESRRV